MQTKGGEKANGLVRCEFLAIMTFDILPHFFEREMGGNMPKDQDTTAWDTKCKAFAALLHIPPEKWYLVHYPFSVSFDNDPRHCLGKVSLLLPRVPMHEEAWSMWKEAHDVCGISNIDLLANAIDRAYRARWSRVEKELKDAKAAREDIGKGIKDPQERARKRKQCDDQIKAAEAVYADYVALRQALTFINLAQGEPAAQNIAPNGPAAADIPKEKLAGEFITQFLFKGRRCGKFSLVWGHATTKEVAHQIARDVFKSLDDTGRLKMLLSNVTIPFRMFLRRRLAARDPRWRCLVPPQIMYLAKSTPDVHQAAEHGVSVAKSAVKQLAAAAEPAKFEYGTDEDPGLLNVRPWVQKMLQKVKDRDENGLTMYMVSRDCERMMCLAKVLAAAEGQEVTITFNFKKDDSHLPVEQRETHVIRGTAGRWCRHRRLNG